MFPRTLCYVLTVLAWAGARQSTLQDLGDNLDSITDDECLFKEYYHCLLNKGPCNKESSNFRDVVQDALENGCERCSANQHKDAIQVLRNVMECWPREYAEIERQFDPSGAFKNKYKMSLIASRYRL